MAQGFIHCETDAPCRPIPTDSRNHAAVMLLKIRHDNLVTVPPPRIAIQWIPRLMKRARWANRTFYEWQNRLAPPTTPTICIPYGITQERQTMTVLFSSCHTSSFKSGHPTVYHNALTVRVKQNARKVRGSSSEISDQNGVHNTAALPGSYRAVLLDGLDFRDFYCVR